MDQNLSRTIGMAVHGSLFKMVKNLYKSNSEPFNPKSRFPVDLHFIAKTFKVLIEDDPFETKLAAVIRHKKDEWVEQVQREEILRRVSF